MTRTGSALALVLLFAVFLMPFPGGNLMHYILDVSRGADAIPDKAAKAFWDDDNSIRAVFHQAQDARNIDVINRASQNFKSSLAYVERKTRAVPDNVRVAIPGIITPHINSSGIGWQIFIEILFAILIVFLFKSKLLSIFVGEDWSKCSSKCDVKIKCIEPMLKSWKLNYTSERPCKFKQCHETLEGKIDFYLYDDTGSVTIFENKSTIKNEEDLKNARAQARSYCIGLYIFENIAVNSFVIASKEGLWIYQIKNNEDHLIEEVSPEKLNWSRKRWIKDKLLEIR